MRPSTAASDAGPDGDPSAPRASHAHRALFAALPDLGLALAFLVTWIRPATLTEAFVRQGMQIMVIEFIVMHSSALMFGATQIGTTPRRKALFVGGMSAFYLLFAAGFAASFRSWWPLLAFGALTANRLLTVLLGAAPGGLEKLLALKAWVVSLVTYLLGSVVTAIPDIPRFGLTREVADRLGFTSGGVWETEPWRVMAFGALYFGVQALSQAVDLFIIRRDERKPIEFA